MTFLASVSPFVVDSQSIQFPYLNWKIWIWQIENRKRGGGCESCHCRKGAFTFILPSLRLALSLLVRPLVRHQCCNVVMSSHLFSRAFEINGSLWKKKIIDTFFMLPAVARSATHKHTIQTPTQTFVCMYLVVFCVHRYFACLYGPHMVYNEWYIFCTANSVPLTKQYFITCNGYSQVDLGERIHSKNAVYFFPWFSIWREGSVWCERNARINSDEKNKYCNVSE